MYSGGVYNRRKRALDRLIAQKKAGTKTEKAAAITLYTTGANLIPLDEKDVKRIDKEISTLKLKLGL